MKTWWVLGMVALLMAHPCFGQDGNGEPTEPTQGQFLLQLVSDTEAQSLFEGSYTAIDVSQNFGNFGLVPDGGWKVTEPLTKEVLASAYVKLVMTNRSPDSEEPPPNTDGMTIDELKAAIVEAVKNVVSLTTSERQPVSPSRPIVR